MEGFKMIKLENISKIYKGDTYEIQALDDVSLQINKGDFLSIMGRSGSGKTTLLNIIGFLSSFNDGKFYFNDEDVSNLKIKRMWKYRRDNIGFIFQNFALIDHLTVFENVSIPLEGQGIRRKKRKEIINDMLKKMGIEELSNKYPGQISGGQRQRVAIARALVTDNDLILADEPTGALDSSTAKDIMDVLTEINKKGKTVVVVTHDRTIAEMTNRIVTLEDGKIVSDDDIKNKRADNE